MRILVLYDLPNSDAYESKEYLHFRKDLLRNGYVMMQYSVYMKCVNTQSKVSQEINKINNHVPSNGNIRILAITEKQYTNMKIILGKKNENEKYNSPERYLKI